MAWQYGSFELPAKGGVRSRSLNFVAVTPGDCIKSIARLNLPPKENTRARDLEFIALPIFNESDIAKLNLPAISGVRARSLDFVAVNLECGFETECVKWHGKIPGSATIEVPSVGLAPGGTFTIPLNQVSYDNFYGYERCPTWMPYKVSKIPFEDTEIWYRDSSKYRPIPWFLRDCYPYPMEQEYLPPPCEEHVQVNEDGTMDVSKPGVETPIPLQFHGAIEAPGGCEDPGWTDWFSLRITLRFISSTLHSCGPNCRDDYFPQGVCGDYQRECLCTPDASKLLLEITGGASFSGITMDCGEPARPEWNQEAVDPKEICINNTFSLGYNIPYLPEKSQYVFTQYPLNPAGCWDNKYSTNPCDYEQKVTINMVDNPNQL